MPSRYRKVRPGGSREGSGYAFCLTVGRGLFYVRHEMSLIKVVERLNSEAGQDALRGLVLPLCGTLCVENPLLEPGRRCDL